MVWSVFLVETCFKGNCKCYNQICICVCTVYTSNVLLKDKVQWYLFYRVERDKVVLFAFTSVVFEVIEQSRRVSISEKIILLQLLCMFDLILVVSGKTGKAASGLVWGFGKRKLYFCYEYYFLEDCIHQNIADTGFNCYSSILCYYFCVFQNGKGF